VKYINKKSVHLVGVLSRKILNVALKRTKWDSVFGSCGLGGKWKGLEGKEKFFTEKKKLDNDSRE
jgi:hypothetical protein